jgi:hypothetical protein
MTSGGEVIISRQCIFINFGLGIMVSAKENLAIKSPPTGHFLPVLLFASHIAKSTFKYQTLQDR